MIDYMDFDNSISDEMLAAYIDGNVTEQEAILIEDTLSGNDSLMETIDIVNDAIKIDDYMMTNSLDWTQTWMQHFLNQNAADILMPPYDLSTGEGLGIYGDNLSPYSPNDENMFNDDIIQNDL